MTPELLTEKRFGIGSTPRSKPYREGFLAGARSIAARLRGEGKCPYPAGSTHADAWWAGANEAISLHREEITVAA